jgi:hypothetical protein
MIISCNSLFKHRLKSLSPLAARSAPGIGPRTAEPLSAPGRLCRLVPGSPFPRPSWLRMQRSDPCPWPFSPAAGCGPLSWRSSASWAGACLPGGLDGPGGGDRRGPAEERPRGPGPCRSADLAREPDGQWLERFRSQSEALAQNALEPFGYYRAAVLLPAGGGGRGVAVAGPGGTGRTDPHRPSGVLLLGPGGRRMPCGNWWRPFPPGRRGVGSSRYEEAKAAIQTLAQERGYLDAATPATRSSWPRTGPPLPAADPGDRAALPLRQDADRRGDRLSQLSPALPGLRPWEPYSQQRLPRPSSTLSIPNASRR